MESHCYPHAFPVVARPIDGHDEAKHGDKDSLWRRGTTPRHTVASLSRDEKKSMELPEFVRLGGAVGDGILEKDMQNMDTIRELEEALSDATFTQQKVVTLAEPEDMPRPRGLFRDTQAFNKRSRKLLNTDGREYYPDFATRAHRNIIHRSTGSRIRYTLTLLNMILWIPLWLKLLTVRRELFNEHHVAIWNSSVHMWLHVSTFDDPGGAYCNLCDKSKVFDGITYPVLAEIKDFNAYPNIPTPNYVVLLGSYDFENWFVVNELGTFTGLSDGDSMHEICLEEAMPRQASVDDDYGDDALVDDATDTVAQKETSFKDYHKSTTTTTADGAVDEMLEYQEVVTSWVTTSPTSYSRGAGATPAPTTIGDTMRESRLSRCCLGNPGFIYLVACATPYEYLKTAGFYGRVGGPPFDGQCVAVAGRCGVACGVDAEVPIKGTCKNGVIPIDELVDEDVLYPQRKRKSRRIRHYDYGQQKESARARAYHVSFVLFVTMMAIGTWISFLAGTGKVDAVPKPSMSEVEAFMASDSPERKPLCLVAFSISASEPRMMVLRNFCGKLNSWIHQRKFTLQPRSAADAIFKTNDEVAKKDDEGENDDVASSHYGSVDSPVSSAGENADIEKIAQGRNNLTEYGEFIDIFQDEGHRVGAYALWDAFVSLVHDTDLRFVECMAKKMTKMTAEDDRLLGKATDDSKLLDDELIGLASRPEIGVSQKSVDRLELAFACFDLLSALGHHAFWRSDGRVNVVGFRDLASNTTARTTLRQWAANFKKERRLNNPFAGHIAPTDSEGISTNVWNAWWELYNEMGRSQWLKRFDCIKFRQVRLHYYRQKEENIHRDLMMCYSARANPEDLKIQLAPTRNRRGICRGVFVRLKEADSKETAACFAEYGIRRLTRSEARRCHARVVSSFNIEDRLFVKVKECTPELLRVLPIKYIASQRLSEDDEEDDDDDLEDNENDTLFRSILLSSVAGEEAILPADCIQPLRESRGKSGGMNTAMEIINYYLRHHSSTFHLMSQKRLGAAPSHQKKQQAADAHLLFAIFDCRHMATQGFWDTVIPYFFAYRYV